MLSSEDMPASEAGEHTPARPETNSVREHLQRILDSKHFSRAESLRRLLRFLVEETLLGHGNQLTEYLLGQEVFGRGEQFDPKIDTIVRVQTRKLRARLDEYYRTQGGNDRVVLKLPKGGYEVVFEAHDPALPAAAVAEQPQTRPGLRRLLWFGLVAGSPAIALAVWYGTIDTPAPAVKTVPFTTFAGSELDPAFSPDGRQVAFAWNGQLQDNFDIYIKGIDSDAPLRLTTHSGEDRNPVWSPDGQRLAFIRRFEGKDEVLIVPVLGGPEQRVHTLGQALILCPIGVSCLSWSPDGDSLAIADKTSPGNAQSVFLLSLRTLQLRQLTHPPTAQSWGDVSPSFSPDGQSLAFVRWSTTASDAFIIPVTGGEPRRITSDRRIIFSVDWMPDGRELVFSSDRVGSGGIWTIPISGGNPRLVVATTDIAVLSAARRGNRLAYWRGPISPDTNIWRIDLTRPADAPVRVIASTWQEVSADFSPKGDRIVFNSNSSGSHEIWMCDRDGSNLVQLTDFAGAHAGSPRWSPDGQTIAFDAQSTRSSDADIHVIDVETRLPRRLTMESSEDVVPCWSEDARWIYFGSTRSGNWQIWKLPAQGGGAVQVTRAGGVITVGTQSGFIYYLKNMEASIWRVPEQGGREEKVVNTPAFHFSRYSALSRRGIYFLDPNAPHPVPRTISFLNFDTRRVTRIATMPGKPVVWEAGISVSTDGRWMLYTQVDEDSGDITLVENFR